MYFLNILCYLGFAPEVFISKEKYSNSSNFAHVINGLFLNLLLAISFIFFIYTQIAEWLIFVDKENTLSNNFIITLMDYASFIPFLIWFFFFAIGLVLSVFNISFAFPLLGLFFNNKVFNKFIVGFLIFMQTLTILTIGITIRAVKLTNSNPQTATVYMIYENALYIGQDTYSVPKWIFSLGFYPIAEISNYRWGAGSVSVQPLSQDSLETALKNGRFVFIASHGNYGLLSNPTSSKGYIEPADIIPLGKNNNLQFVYLAGCKSGDLKELWELVFSPAKVKTFDRFSWIPEHVVWLWFSGPKIVSSLQ